MNSSTVNSRCIARRIEEMQGEVDIDNTNRPLNPCVDAEALYGRGHDVKSKRQLKERGKQVWDWVTI